VALIHWAFTDSSGWIEVIRLLGAAVEPHRLKL
jgi:hypothetical protein